MRLLPKKQIPQSVWTGTHLQMPPTLADEYRNELNARGLFEKSLERVEHGTHGGATKEETEDHFAGRFPNSVGRATYVICSPCGTFDDVSDTVLSIFSTGHVALLDIPCGTGALSGAIVSLLIELRKSHVLPSLPLTITLYGGDFSDHARTIFECLMGRLSAKAAQVGITIVFQTIHWDAGDDRDTAKMVDNWFLSSTGASDHLVAVLNFSGDLHKEENFRRFEPCIRQILGRLHSRQSAFVWIEPASNSALKKMWNLTKQMVFRAPYMSDLFRLSDQSQVRSKDFTIAHPFTHSLIPSSVCLPLFRPIVIQEP